MYISNVFPLAFQNRDWVKMFTFCYQIVSKYMKNICSTNCSALLCRPSVYIPRLRVIDGKGEGGEKGEVFSTDISISISALHLIQLILKN